MPTNRSPRVSIGIPVYNGENFLAEAIDSLLAQTYEDFELIISDNGSSDATESICQRFAQSDDRIRYERHERNRGAAWNYNRVLALARGEYFKWSAHDDLHDATYLMRCVEVLDSDPSVAWVHTRCRIIDARGQVIRGRLDTLGAPNNDDCNLAHGIDEIDPGVTSCRRSSARPCQRLTAILLNANWCLDLYGLTRTAMLRKTRGFLATYGSEKIALAELAFQGRYREVPEVLFSVRVHPESSGRHLTVAGQQHHVGPRRGSHWISPRIQLVVDHLAGIHRAPIGTYERVCCYVAVGKYLLQIRKWKRVLTTMINGTGTGGGNRFFKDASERTLLNVEADRKPPLEPLQAKPTQDASGANN